MSIDKKLAHKAEAANGAAKKYFGRATGNTRLAAEGHPRPPDLAGSSPTDPCSAKYVWAGGPSGESADGVRARPMRHLAQQHRP